MTFRPTMVRLVLLCLLLPAILASAPRPGKPRVCTVADKPYRSLAVASLSNASRDGRFDYLSASLALFLAEDLRGVESVTVRTSEIALPARPDRPVAVAGSDLSNLRRRLVVIARGPSATTDADYLVRGAFARIREDLWWFRLDLYDADRRLVFSCRRTNDQRTVLDDVPFLGLPLKSFLNAGRGRMVVLASDGDETSVRIAGGTGAEDRFLGFTPVSYYLTADNRSFTFSRKGFRSRTTNLHLGAGDRTVLVQLSPDNRFRRLSVRTVPAGTAVYLDESFLGLSPVSADLIAPRRSLLSISVSNRAVLVRPVLLDRDRSFVFDLASLRRGHSGFPNRGLAWAFLAAGSLAVGYGVWNAAEAENQRRLLPARRTVSPAVLNSRAAWGYAASVPFFSLTVWFSARASDEKDW